jgi:tetratricopeptide (TPR) repeat protein
LRTIHLFTIYHSHYIDSKTIIIYDTMNEKTSEQFPVFSQEPYGTIQVPLVSATSAPASWSNNTHSRNFTAKNVRLVLLHSHTDESNDIYVDALTQLRNIHDYVTTFTDSDECVDFLTDIEDEKIFMILSGTVQEETISLIHGIHQLDTIIIYSDITCIQEQLIRIYPKVKGVYTKMTSICEVLKQFIKLYDHDSISISLFPAINDTSISNLLHFEPLFMCAQVFKEIMLTTEYNEQSKKDFIMHYRSKYIDNVQLSKIIDEFEREYRPELSIMYYTRHPFFYQMLNRALLTFGFGTVIGISFFFQDLHRQIEKLHTQQVATRHGSPLNVYRGQRLSNMDLQNLVKSIRGIISFNNFLSTNTDRKTALGLAEDALTKPDTVGILFEICITDRSYSSHLFADINDISNSEGENEILFTMGALFRIDGIRKIGENDRLYQVKLELTSDSDQQRHALTNLIKNKMYRTKKGWHRMGMLLIEQGHLRHAAEVYRTIQEEAVDDNEKALIYDILGSIEHKLGGYKTAASYYEKALEIKEKFLPPDHLDLVYILSDMASTYRKLGEYSKAVSCYNKATEILSKSLLFHNLPMAQVYQSLAWTYSKMRDYSEALHYFDKAVKIQQEALPLDYSMLASSYKNIGWVYSEMNDFLTALSHYDKALEIEQKTLPYNHPNFAVTYNFISSAYIEIFEYSRALSYCDKALKIGQIIFPLNHPVVITTYNNVGLVYNSTGEYSKALAWFKKALDTHKESSPLDDLSMVETYNNMGRVYDSMEEFLNAISYYKKALKIQKVVLPYNDPSVADTCIKIGRTHIAMEHYSYALTYYQDALAIQQKALSPYHSLLAETYIKLGEMYRLTGDCPAALTSYEKALNIQKHILPLNHPSLATSYCLIGQILCSEGNYETALVYLEKTLEIQSESLPRNHPSLVLSHFKIATILKSLHRNEEAEKHASRACVIASHNVESDGSEMQKYQQDLKEFLATIVSVDVMKELNSKQ